MAEVVSIFSALLLQIVLPGVAASAATLLCLAVFAKWVRVPPWIEALFTPLAVTAGIVAGNYYRHDAPFWSLDHDWYGLLPATFAAIFVTSIGESLRAAKHPNWAIFLRSVAALIAAFWLTPPDAPGSRWLWVGILFATFQTNYYVLSGPWNDALGRNSLISIGVVWGCACAITLLAFVHAMRYFDSVAVLCSGLVGAGLVCCFSKSNPRAAFIAPASFLPALMLYAYQGSITDVPPASFVLLGLAPAILLLGIPELSNRLESWSPRWRAFVWLVLITIPLTAAVAMAAMNEKSDSTNEGEVSV